MTLSGVSFMNQISTSNNIENDDLDFNTKENDYKKLINRLKEIKITISLLEKIIFK